LQDKSGKSFKDKLKNFFFGAHKKPEEVYKGVWEAKEGSKWIYFKERSHDKPGEDENKEDVVMDETQNFSATEIVQSFVNKKETQNDSIVPLSFTSSRNQLSYFTDDGVETFSVTEFARKHGHRGELPKEKVEDPSKSEESPDKKDEVKKAPDGDLIKKRYPEAFWNNLELENAINEYIKDLEKDPYNDYKRKKLIRFFLEKSSYTEALQECYNLLCRLKNPVSSLIFSGDIRSISPFYVFQVLVSNKKSGRMNFFLAGEEASVFFLQGKAVHAKDRWGKGEEVIKRILIWQEGLFNFIPDELPMELTITRSTSRILNQIVGTPMKTDILTL